MIHQNPENINTENEIHIHFISAIKELKISQLLHQCGIRKTSRTIAGESSGNKRTAFEIFQFLILLVFQGRNLYRFPGSKKQDIACSKSTCHRFLNDCHYSWRRFITLLAANIIAYFDTLTSPNRSGRRGSLHLTRSSVCHIRWSYMDLSFHLCTGRKAVL